MCVIDIIIIAQSVILIPIKFIRKYVNTIDKHDDKEEKILIKVNWHLDLSSERNIIFAQAVCINCDMRRDKSRINNIEDVIYNVRWSAAISARLEEKLLTIWYC